jgi:hypothetical protein
VADGSLTDRLEPEAVALSGDDRQLLHRVLGMLEGELAYAGWTDAGPGNAGELHYGDHIAEPGRVMRVKMILINQRDTNYRDVTLADPGGTEHRKLMHVFDEVQLVEPTPQTVNRMRAERRALYTRLVRDHGLIGWESRGNDAREAAADLDDLRGMAAEVEDQAPDPLRGIPAGYHGLAGQAIDESLARAPALAGDDEAAGLAGPQGSLRGPGLRAAIGDGTRPQERALTAAERADLGDAIRRLIEEWERPRLFRDPTPAWDLTGADIARLGLIWRALSPPAEDADSALVVNAADWAPPDGIPDGWVVANAPRPIRGPVGALAWEGEERHGRFYAAWPVEDDDDVYWEASGAREVVLWSNQEMAASAGRYLAACGLLPGEGGLTATEVARRLRPPWKEGILDDEQVQDAALAAILEVRRDHEDQAYDFSDSPQRRELTGAERAFLSRLAGQAAADPRWADEAIARHPGTRAALGDGTGPQRRPLTARERDDIARMVMLIDSDYHYDRQRPGYQPRWPWVAELTGGDVARLRLIDGAITARRGDRAIDDQVFVNAADWTPPEPIPDRWVTACASVPLAGPVMWAGPDLGNGEFYAAAPPGDDPFDAWHAEAQARVVPVKAVTDEEAVEAAYAFLAAYQCTAPGDAGMTVTEVARDLGYPLPPARADAAVTAAGTTWTLRASRGNGKARWYALHGTRARDRIAADLASDGYQVTPATAIPPGEAAPAEASTGARATVNLALRYGWDVVYIPHARGETVTALNTDTRDGQVSQAWDRRGHLVRGDDLDKIGSRPRPRCAAAPGLPGPGSPGPAALEFPAGPAATPRKGRRTAGPGNPAASARRAPPRP